MITIIISKLGMSVEDTIEEFHRICNEVYVDGLSAAERTGRLRKAIERESITCGSQIGARDTSDCGRMPLVRSCMAIQSPL
jgi:type II secretory pathway component PulF